MAGPDALGVDPDKELVDEKRLERDALERYDRFSEANGDFAPVLWRILGRPREAREGSELDCCGDCRGLSDEDVMCLAIVMSGEHWHVFLLRGVRETELSG